ncbi:MAG: glycosyltransferase family 2 protein [Candidatus Brocadiaceae bacterium]|nr:glycosyltransferase family 2 protein [Candidatus Brocadiaceae bacterium]
MPNQLFVSIIIPVHNAEEFTERCLDALLSSTYPSFEIIVADDCSTDDRIAVNHQKRITLLRLSEHSGPSAARNFGAQHARGDILMFIDSDVIVRRETLSMVVADFLNNPGVAAVFGSYDDKPAKGNFISQYRNLFHHFHHQCSDTEAFTFWGGCGAVRKQVFIDMGGFDQKRYKKPSIEDIELGYRLRKKGYRILLNKDLQVKHLKQWTFLSMVRTDIFQRAIPWSRLILEEKWMPKDLNLQMSYKISAISTVLILLLIPILLLDHAIYCAIPINSIACIFSLMLFVTILILNRKIYFFYARKRGVSFMLKVLPFHLVYYLYSSMSFAYCWITHKTATFGSLLFNGKLK